MYTTEAGGPHPLGAVPDNNGVSFTLFSQHASSVELLIFAKHDDPFPVQTIVLDPTVHKTFHFWHVYVKGLKAGTHYAYRVDGPWNPSGEGHRFNRNKVLTDPYSKGNTSNLFVRGDACGWDDNVATSMRSVVVDTATYDWEGDTPLARPMANSIIYEMHVAGFTKSATSNVKNPGTFRGAIEKIPYLQDLGITAVELLPVFDFDANEVLRNGPTNCPLVNYWGYSTIGFFAPEDTFCVTPECGDHVTEFRDMVKAFHKAGIEVILDVVFNHTDEGNHQGPVLNFKGIDNSLYYHLVDSDKQYYMDYTGCGNTFNCNHPVAEKFITDCLEYWVREMHVDGFRFDEASVLSRGMDGVPMEYPPVLWHIELSETLADSKIIAEAWDAAGAYQVGHFPGYRWAEWNGRYRDDIRKFVRGELGIVSQVAARIAGSADIYETNGHLPINSINFVTCHDGFTLYDLVSYNEKHNWANGENNNDGNDDNTSWNCGAEGETEDEGIRAFRRQQIKNFAVILLSSQGVPMIVAGDEVCRTQRGNNNAYCQDNEISWFNWDNAKDNEDMLRFWQLAIAFRQNRRHKVFQRKEFFHGNVVNSRGLSDIAWHGCELNSPGWDNPGCGVLAYTLGDIEDGIDVHVMLNMEAGDLEFSIPDIQGRHWYTAVDTAKPSPEDIYNPGKEPKVKSDRVLVKSHAAVVLISK